MRGAEPIPAELPAPLLIATLVYGGLVCIAGVLGSKLVAVGPLAVEGGASAFLLLVVTAGVVAEVYGRRLANRLVLFGFVPLVLSMLLIRLVLALPAAPIASEEARLAFPLVLGQSTRLMAAGIVAYGVSQLANVTVLTRLRGAGVGSLWLRALLAGVLSQTLDSLVFVTVAFAGVAPLLPLLAGQWLVKLVLSVLVVPLLVEAGVAAIRSG